MAQSHSLRSGRAFRRGTAVAGAVVAAALLTPGVAAATTDTYSGIGKHSWIVPPGVTQLTVEVVGGGGGNDIGGNGCKPGEGATLQGTIPVAQGTQLTIHVGGRGGGATAGGAGGVGADGGDLDGGGGGTAGANSPLGGGGGGGGSMISSTDGPLVVAGGGGGCGGFANGLGLGDGGNHATAGADGSQSAQGGGGATGGIFGSGGASDPATGPGAAPGTGSTGGDGAGTPALRFGGGGGGGGYAGGGGGGGAELLHGIAGGGGGGGDFVPAGVTLTPQGSTGNGHVTITYTSSWTGTVVGKQFVPRVNKGPYRNGWTLLQTGAPDQGNPWIIPSTGVITAWGFHTASPVPDTLELKVGRGGRVPVSGGYFTIVGSSPGAGLVPNQLNTYAVRIPVQAGDMLGAYQTGATNLGFTAADNFPEYAAARDGNAALGSNGWFELDDYGEIVPVVARVEPDADSDGFGDLSQDLCLAQYGTANGCPQADLALTATANATSVNVGQDVIYTLTATNKGPDPVPVTITDPVPAGATFVTAVSNPGSCVAGPPVTCDLGTIASGQSGTATVIFQATQAGTLSNTATVAGPAVPTGVGAGDPSSANNSATVATDVLAPGSPPGTGSPGAGTPGGGTPGADPPGTPAFKGVAIRLKNGKINVTRGIARVTLFSTLAAKGRFKLTTVTGKGKKRRTIVLGQAAFTVAAGKTHTVTLRLGKSVLTLLRKHGRTLKVLAVATASDKAGVTKTNHKSAKLKLLSPR